MAGAMRWTVRLEARTDRGEVEATELVTISRPAVAGTLAEVGLTLAEAKAFLAGLQAIPRELYEAAEIDGASVVQQFFYVTVPRLRTIFLTTVMLSTIWTATNLQFVLILTRGGPASRTEIFPHLAYTTALGARRLGMGAVVVDD